MQNPGMRTSARLLPANKSRLLASFADLSTPHRGNARVNAARPPRVVGVGCIFVARDAVRAPPFTRRVARRVTRTRDATLADIVVFVVAIVVVDLSVLSVVVSVVVRSH